MIQLTASLWPLGRDSLYMGAKGVVRRPLRLLRLEMMWAQSRPVVDRSGFPLDIY